MLVAVNSSSGANRQSERQRRPQMSNLLSSVRSALFPRSQVALGNALVRAVALQGGALDVGRSGSAPLATPSRAVDPALPTLNSKFSILNSQFSFLNGCASPTPSQ